MSRLTWSLAVGVVALAGPARADVLYSNLGPGDSYVQDFGWVESGPNSSFGTVRLAVGFTVGGTDTVFDGARLAVGLRSGANEIDLRLYNTVGGQPGTVLETMHLSGQLPDFGDFGSGHLVEFDSAAHPLLRAGGTYWLLPFAPGDTLAAWSFNDQARNGLLATSDEPEPTSWGVSQDVEGAFDVSGTPSPAPEPSGLTLAGVGLAGMAGFVWRKARSS
jgi:hypothetical protein